MKEVRVKQESEQKYITALGGMLFSANEWMSIPEDEQLEQEAENNPFLEVREVSESALVQSEPVPPEPEEIADDEEDEEAGQPEYSASPSAVELAEELGIDLSLVEGTGAGGNIIKSDVVAYSESLSEEES